MFLFARLMSRVPQVLVTLVVFSLSSGVLGGVLLYMDAVGPEVLEDFTEDVPVDMKVQVQRIFQYQNETTLADIIETIENQTHVLRTESVTYVESYDWNQADHRYFENTYLGVDSTFLQTFPDALQNTEENLQFNDTTCWLEAETMDHLDLALGDNYTVKIRRYDDYGQETVEKENFTIVGTFTSRLFMRSYYWEGQDTFTSLRMVTTKGGLIDRISPLFPSNEVRYGIWTKIDRGLVVFSDPAQTIDELDNIRRRIEQRLLPYAAVPYDGFDLRDAVSEYVSWVFVIRAISVAFCLPTILMGILLVYYNSNLLADEQRRDVGTLKTRGASGRQAFRWIMGSAMFTAIIGSLGAIGTGIVGAIVSSTVRTFMDFNLDQLGQFSFFFTHQSFVFIFAFSFAVGALFALPAAMKALTITATEAHSIVQRENLLEREDIGNPFFDIIGFAFSAYLLVPLLMILGYGFNLIAVASIMLLVTPLLAITLFTFIRGTARMSPSFKSAILERIKKPQLAAASRVFSRASTVFKKSEVIGTMFIALVFTAGVFSSVSATSGYTHMEHLFWFENGADIKVELNPVFGNMTAAFVNNLTAIEGVSSASAILEAKGHATYRTLDIQGIPHDNNVSIDIIGVQPEEYESTGFWLPYFAYKSTPQQALQAMQLANSNVLSSFRPLSHFTGQYPNRRPVYADEFRLELSGPDEKHYLDCHIIDTLTQGEAGGTTYLPGFNTNSFVLVNLDYVQMALNTSRVSRYFVSIEKQANYTQIVRDIYEFAPNNIVSIESSHQRLDQALDAKAGQSVFGIYTLNVVFALVYLTAGMTVVSVIRVRKLRREFSIMRALGSETRDIMLVAGVDVIASVLLATAIGSLFGIVLASLVSQIPLVFMDSSAVYLWSRLPVMIAIPVELLIGIIITAFAFSLVAALMVTWRCLQANIAEEIQYAE